MAKVRRWSAFRLSDGFRWVQMVGHGAKFTGKKEEAIAALLLQRSVEEAARAAGIGTQTSVRWLKLPEFVKEYRKARREAVHQSVARMQQATGAAATTVLKLMTDMNIPAAVRLRAAECVFDRAFKGIELEDIEARVSELERASEASKGGRGAMRRFGSSSPAGTP